MISLSKSAPYRQKGDKTLRALPPAALKNWDTSPMNTGSPLLIPSPPLAPPQKQVWSPAPPSLLRRGCKFQTSRPRGSTSKPQGKPTGSLGNNQCGRTAHLSNRQHRQPPPQAVCAPSATGQAQAQTAAFPSGPTPVDLDQAL